MSWGENPMQALVEFLKGELEQRAIDKITKDTPLYETITVYGMTYGLAWGFDTEQDEIYVSVGFNLPHDTTVFAEIEDGTYGQMQALRIYLPEASELSRTRRESQFDFAR